MENTAHVSRDLARLMLMMRRLIKEEFTVTVHLDDSDAAEELLAFGGRSRSSLLRDMARELEALTGAGTTMPEPESGVDAAERADATGTATTYYRGAPVQRASQPDPQPQPQRKNAGKRIYRGRVVE